MPYTVKIRKQAKKKLSSLPRPQRQRIAEKIHKLGLNPDDEKLDIKKLEGEDRLFRFTARRSRRSQHSPRP